MYGTMYAVLLTSAHKEMAVLASQVKSLSPAMSPLAAGPLREKYNLFRCFLGLAFCSLLLEVVCRYLYAARVGPFYVLVMVYELGSTVLVVLLGWLYRPRQFSPFFFMMPTSLEYGALLSQQEEMEEETVEGGGGGRIGSLWQEERRARMSLLDRRVHSREREDDVADLERMRFARVHRLVPIVQYECWNNLPYFISLLSPDANLRSILQFIPLFVGLLPWWRFLCLVTRTIDPPLPLPLSLPLQGMQPLPPLGPLLLSLPEECREQELEREIPRVKQRVQRR